ncbi:MAG: pirin family protein [Gammaproteobacteria bacterium]
MIIIRKSFDRGHSQIGWLSSFHTFSFSEYYDPEFMGFGSLRVINEDTVQPGYGFGKHPHKDMEIISYIVEGSLEHKDSMGTGSVIKPGEIQIMSAGTQVEHSEFNHSKSDLLHFLQIWIIPEKPGLKPRYDQKKIFRTNNNFILIGSKDEVEDAVTIHQDVNLYAAYLTQNHSIDYEFKNNRQGWLQLIKGKINLNGFELSSGDGAAIQNEKMIHVQCIDDAELLFFDLV